MTGVCESGSMGLPERRELNWSSGKDPPYWLKQTGFREAGFEKQDLRSSKRIASEVGEREIKAHNRASDLTKGKRVYRDKSIKIKEYQDTRVSRYKSIKIP